MPVISDTVFNVGVPYNGASVDAWKASRFSGVPAEGASPPVGTADAGPVNSGPTFGGEGAFQITVPTTEDYYIRAVISGKPTAWKLFPAGVISGAGSVNSVTAGNTTITIGGSASAPTVALGTVPESAITGLTTDLAAKATNPMTTAGDIITGGTSGVPARLASGADKTILTIDASTHLPAWDAPANPMTTVGDVITGGAAGVPQRLGIGAAGSVLTIDPSTLVPAWDALGIASQVLMAETTNLGGTIFSGTGDLTMLTIPITINTANTRVRTVCHLWYQLNSGSVTNIAWTLTGPDGTARAIPTVSSTTWSTPTWEVPALAVIATGGYNITLAVIGTAGVGWKAWYQVLVYLVTTS